MKLDEIIEKPISGEWGDEDVDGVGVPVLRATNFTDEGVLNWDSVVTRLVAPEKREKKYLRPGDVIIEKSGGSDKRPVGRVVFYDGPERRCLSNNFTAALRLKEPLKFNAKFLFYALFAVYRRGGTEAYQNKTTGIRNLRLQRYLSELEIPSPSLAEQERIVAELDAVAATLKKRRAQLAELDAFVRARFVELFGDPSREARFPTQKLTRLGELNRGVSKRRPRNAPELLGGPYPLIQTGDVANAELYIRSFQTTYSELGLAQSKLWKTGALCVTIAANIAKTAILTFDACFPDSVVGFIPEAGKTNALFIHYWFSFFQKILEEQAPQVAQKNINLKILSELQVIVPPFELQERFAAEAERVEAIKASVRDGIAETQALFEAFLQRYFG